MRYLGVAQFGSVLEWGSRGRKFESSHPDLKDPLSHLAQGVFLSVVFLLRYCQGV